MDKWTLNSSTYKIVSPPAGLPLEARVCELIEQTLGTWKADLIQSIYFLEHEMGISSPVDVFGRELNLADLE